jgi:glycosyltransferase involved in cell wall biosynthesis
MKPTEFFLIPESVRKEKKLSILMPFLNEEKIIVQNALEVVRIMRGFDFNFEIILVDDGSRDRSYELLSAEFNGHTEVRVVRNYQNFGKGWALKTGYEYSTGDYVLFLDSDLELSPEHIPNFFRLMIEENSDAVIGSKLHPDSDLEYPLARKLYSFVYYSLIKILFGLPVMDSQTGIKLFKREALEEALPKVLVKKFAFDIELLLLLFKNRRKIVSAPIQLRFSRGKFTGNIRFRTIYAMIVDTLAIFYRDRILGFYNRPLGPNTAYSYTILLFPENYDDYEAECLKRFLFLQYGRYDVLCVGEKPFFDLVSGKLRFIECGDKNPLRRLEAAVKSGLITGEYVLLSSLNSYPDERFLFTTGRIFSQGNIGAAGGFVVLRQNFMPFEKIAYSVKRSFFLNLDLSYRYQPGNYKNVKELQADGMFVRKSILERIDFHGLPHTKLEFVISKEVLKEGCSLVYSPDIMLYKRFADSPGELLHVFAEEASLRAGELRVSRKRYTHSLLDRRFTISVLLILFFLLSAGVAIGLKNPWWALPAAVYLVLLYLTRVFMNGFINGFRIFWLTLASQFAYGISYLVSLFGGRSRT